MDHAVVPDAGDRNTGLVELAGIGFGFISQHVHFCSLDECWREVFELLNRCTERRGKDLVALFRIRGVVVPKPLHHRCCQEVILAIRLVGSIFEAGIGHRP